MAIISIFLATLLSSLALTNGQFAPQGQQQQQSPQQVTASTAQLNQLLQQQLANQQRQQQQAQQGTTNAAIRQGTPPQQTIQLPQQQRPQQQLPQQTLPQQRPPQQLPQQQLPQQNVQQIPQTLPGSNAVNLGAGNIQINNPPNQQTTAIRQTPPINTQNNQAVAAAAAAVAAQQLNQQQQNTQNVQGLNQQITSNNNNNAQNRILGGQPLNNGLAGGLINALGGRPNQISNNIQVGQNGFQFGNNNNNGRGLFNNPIAQAVQGTYQWIAQDGNVYTLYVCSGLQGDRYMYGAVQRTNINAFGAPDNSVQFAFIVARGISRIASDGHNTQFAGFRLSDAFGVDTDFRMMLTYSRCDNIYQLETNDEVYTLIKISFVHLYLYFIYFFFIMFFLHTHIFFCTFITHYILYR